MLQDILKSVDTLNKDLASFQHGMFATREGTGSAIEYAHSIINSLPPSDKVAVITALQVVINSLTADAQTDLAKIATALENHINRKATL